MADSPEAIEHGLRNEFHALCARLREVVNGLLAFQTPLSKCFVPNGAVFASFRGQRDSINRLIWIANAFRARSLNDDELLRLKDRVLGSSHEELRSIKIFAILVCLSLEPDSYEWMRFVEVCAIAVPNLDEAKRASTCDLSLPTERRPDLLRDCDLPLSKDEIKQHLSPTRHHLVFGMQYQFCAVVIYAFKEMEFIDEEMQEQRMPYMEENQIGQGSFGSVYAVKIAPGHWHSREGPLGGDLWRARKDIDLREGAEKSVEWSVGKLIREVNQEHRNIVKTLAMLRFPDKISIFFHLAHCDLEVFLRGRKDPEDRTWPPSFREPSKLKPEPQIPPHDLYGKLRMLNRMLQVADALRFLHSELSINTSQLKHDRHHTESREPAVCIHQDLKPGNILVYGEKMDDFEFKIADFSISSVKSGGNVRNLNYPFKQRASNITTLSKAGDANECLAPEAFGEYRHVTIKADVWSFACVLSLYLVWLFEGSEKLREFDELRFHASQSRSMRFFVGDWVLHQNLPRETQDIAASDQSDGLSPPPPKVSLKSEIDNWFDAMAVRLRKSGQQQESNLCTTLWSYIRHHMLQINVDKRDRMKKVKQELGQRVRDVFPTSLVPALPRTPSQEPISLPIIPAPAEQIANVLQHVDRPQNSQPWYKVIMSHIRETFRQSCKKASSSRLSGSPGSSGSSGTASPWRARPQYLPPLPIPSKFTKVSPQGDLFVWYCMNQAHCVSISCQNVATDLRVPDVSQRRPMLSPSGEQQWRGFCVGGEYICVAPKGSDNQLVFYNYRGQLDPPDIQAWTSFTNRLPESIDPDTQVHLTISEGHDHEVWIAAIASADDRGLPRIWLKQLQACKNEMSSAELLPVSEAPGNQPNGSHNWNEILISFDRMTFRDITGLFFSSDRKSLIVSTHSLVYVLPVPGAGRRDPKVFDPYYERANIFDGHLVSCITPCSDNLSVCLVACKESIMIWNYGQEIHQDVKPIKSNLERIYWAWWDLERSRIFAVAVTWKKPRHFALYSCQYKPGWISLNFELRGSSYLPLECTLAYVTPLHSTAGHKSVVILANVRGQVDVLEYDRNEAT